MMVRMLTEVTEPRRFSIVRSDGLRLTGDERGDPSSPSVLLLPATGRSRYMWSELARRLTAKGLHVVNVDFHGQGDSDWSIGGDYSIDSFVADVLALCKQRGPFNTILGTSLGAVAGALATARAATSVASGIVLVDVEPTIESPDMHRIRTALNRAIHGFESPRDAYAALRDCPGIAHIGVDAHPAAQDALRIDRDGRYHLKCDLRAIDIRQRPLGRARNELIARALGSLSVPVLVVRGVLARYASEAGARHLASLPADGKLVDLSSGRGSRAEPNEVLAALVGEFVRGTVSAAQAS